MCHAMTRRKQDRTSCCPPPAPIMADRWGGSSSWSSSSWSSWQGSRRTQWQAGGVWWQGGDVVPPWHTKGKKATQKRGADVPLGQFVTCFWPVFITFYKNRKFDELQQMAQDAGCSLSLKGRFDAKHARNCCLTVKGVAAKEVFREVWHVTKEMGADMSRVPLAFVQDEELKRKDVKADCDSEVERERKSPRTDAPPPLKKEEERTDLPSPEEEVEEVDWNDSEAEVELRDETCDVVHRSQTEARMPLTNSVEDDGKVDADVMADLELSAELVAEYEAALQEASMGWSLQENETLVAHTAEEWAEGVMENLVGSIPEHFRKEGPSVLCRVRTKTPTTQYTGKFTKQRMAVFCSTCFRRGFQLKKVLPWNLLTMLPYRDVVRYDLVLFGPDEEDTKDVLEFVRKKLVWPMNTGLLRIALAPMKYWSCPEAKNTAHVFATTSPTSRPDAERLLVNADRTAQVEISTSTAIYVQYST